MSIQELEVQLLDLDHNDRLHMFQILAQSLQPLPAQPEQPTQNLADFFRNSPLSRRRTELEAWLNQVVLVQLQQRIVKIDLATMILWGELTGRLEPQGRMLPTMDSLIAAIALQHSFTLVTRNEKDFAGTGLTIFNPWN
jgi:hypothetical protein